jgi:AraC-like DNA-binding protein
MVTLKFNQLSASDVDACAVFAGRCETSQKSTTVFTGTGRKNNLLCFLEEGERRYQIAGREDFILYKNEMIFIPATSCYYSYANPGYTAWTFIDFDLKLGEQEVFIDEPFCILRGAGELLPIMRAMAAPGMGKLAVKGMFFTLLADVAERVRVKEITDRGFFSIYEAVKVIEQHPEKSFSVHELASRCYLSDTGFREKFKRFTGGIAPVEYRNRLRIDRADIMLKSGNFTLETIADQLGFWDTAHFCRMYRQFRGHAPRFLTVP